MNLENILAPFGQPMKNPEETLREAFGSVAYGEYDGKVTCAVSRLYTIRDFHGDKGRLRRRFNRDLPNRVLYKNFGTRRGIVMLEPLQGIGESREESVADLGSFFSSGAHAYLHEPKLGDAFEPVVGKKYVTIHNDDELHVHGDTLMMDFRGVFTPILSTDLLVDENYGDWHAHLMPQETFLERLRSDL